MIYDNHSMHMMISDPTNGPCVAIGLDSFDVPLGPWGSTVVGPPGSPVSDVLCSPIELERKWLPWFL